jgi:hypothetical protein
MSFGDNTLSPFEIEDARDAAHALSEQQRKHEDRIKAASRDLAEAERQYRLKLTERILYLHAQDQVAWTACEVIAKGEKVVADLRYKRDVAKGVLEAAQQLGYALGADRKDLSLFIGWSERRDLRTDTPPASWDQQTGEVRT